MYIRANRHPSTAPCTSAAADKASVARTWRVSLLPGLTPSGPCRLCAVCVCVCAVCVCVCGVQYNTAVCVRYGCVCVVCNSTNTTQLCVCTVWVCVCGVQ